MSERSTLEQQHVGGLTELLRHVFPAAPAPRSRRCPCPRYPFHRRYLPCASLTWDRILQLLRVVAVADNRQTHRHTHTANNTVSHGAMASACACHRGARDASTLNGTEQRTTSTSTCSVPHVLLHHVIHHDAQMDTTEHRDASDKVVERVLQRARCRAGSHRLNCRLDGRTLGGGNQESPGEQTIRNQTLGQKTTETQCRHS